MNADEAHADGLIEVYGPRKAVIILLREAAQLRVEIDRLRALVDQAAALKTLGGIPPGYQEPGHWRRGTLPPPESATDGPPTPVR